MMLKEAERGDVGYIKCCLFLPRCNCVIHLFLVLVEPKWARSTCLLGYAPRQSVV